MEETEGERKDEEQCLAFCLEELLRGITKASVIVTCVLGSQEMFR